MKIQNATFLISGGGSGLGAATARLLAASGANIVIVDVNADTGQPIPASRSAPNLATRPGL
jgi:NAD(P)-dependent dehydrogenase (short-subunit alcohol dehydrogenase family)